ncbi:DUF4128 domain-containing protein [Methylovorus glucosotrophus]|uniref:Uncharacterized protein n=1 Tax=Methylovorus glucosotrophus (strain SIP3-4) TaxID=582744 RepID=C6XE91_METGS|nr:DUF4128 domain-containing protein [Methylovorus glucosotrophus]ACT50866.1 hypothetical protein Msip34_1621 [Methylovorus glucosotrophus SIP3-4]
MSEINIRKAFEKRLLALDTAFATAWPNVEFDPVLGVPYQKPSLLPAAPENPTLGDGYYREVGVFQVLLYYPLGDGPDNADLKALAIKNHFPRALKMTEAGQVIQVMLTPTIAPGFESMERWCIPISINYQSEVNP